MMMKNCDALVEMNHKPNQPYISDHRHGFLIIGGSGPAHKENKKRMKKLVKMSRNNDYITENLLDYSYHQNYYKRIIIYFSRKTNTTILQQTNFIGKLEEDDGTTMFSIAEKQQKLFQTFLQVY